MNPRREREHPPSTRRFLSPVGWAFLSVSGILAAAVAGIALVPRDAPSEGSPGPLPAVSEATAELVATRLLPLEVNAQVDRWIRRFVGADREVFEGYLVREGLYGGLIRERLRSRKMPEELIYLAMIESGFSPTATSSVNAAGVWQFMGSTALHYGLVVDYWVDERRDPIRATDAALDYLEELHSEFGSWYLAAAAYNAGPGRISRAIRRHGAGNVEDDALYWEISDHLPAETREYVPKMLAATLLARQADQFGFEVEKSLPYLFDQVLVPGGTPLLDVAAALHAPHSLIRELNPHLVRGLTPPNRAYMVRVPQGDSYRLVAELDGVLDGGMRERIQAN